MQRDEAAQRGDTDWKPHFFQQARGVADGEEALDWILKSKIDGKTPDEQVAQILSTAPVLPGQSNPSETINQPIPQHDGNSAAASEFSNSQSKDAIGMSRTSRLDSVTGGDTDEFVDARS